MRYRVRLHRHPECYGYFVEVRPLDGGPPTCLAVYQYSKATATSIVEWCVEGDDDRASAGSISTASSRKPE
jgi:hypothetical protein